MQANMYVGSYGIEPQGESESDQTFKERVAGVLRDNNMIIEAHEVIQDARWDDSNKGGDVMAGVIGAMAQTLQGVDYGVSGNSQVGTDIMAGIYSQSEKPKQTPEEILLFALMFGKK